MVNDGIYYALGLTAGGVAVSYLTSLVYGVPLYLLAAFCLYFFRDPDRSVGSSSNVSRSSEVRRFVEVAHGPPPVECAQ
jgi:phosphatidylserine decarboxylase